MSDRLGAAGVAFLYAFDADARFKVRLVGTLERRVGGRAAHLGSAVPKEELEELEAVDLRELLAAARTLLGSSRTG